LDKNNLTFKISNQHSNLWGHIISVYQFQIKKTSNRQFEGIVAYLSYAIDGTRKEMEINDPNMINKLSPGNL